MAQEYYPLKREEVLGNLLEKGGGIRKANDGGLGRDRHSGNQSSASQARQLLSQGAWFNWSDYEAPFPKVEKIIQASLLPDDISKIPDDILNWAIECEVTRKPFRIIKQELDFYRRHRLPIPRKHPDIRRRERFERRV